MPRLPDNILAGASPSAAQQARAAGSRYSAAAGDVLSARTNLEGRPCSVLLPSRSVRREQRVFLHPNSSLVMSHIRSGAAL